MSRIYSIYEAKAKLSQLLRLVKTGTDAVITERGSPIARIIPFEKEPENLENRLAALRDRGMASLATGAFDKDTLTQLRTTSKKPGALKRFLRERD